MPENLGQAKFWERGTGAPTNLEFGWINTNFIPPRLYLYNTGTSTWEWASGNQELKARIMDASGTVQTDEDSIIVRPDTTDVVVTLPDPATMQNQKITIYSQFAKKSGSDWLAVTVRMPIPAGGNFDLPLIGTLGVSLVSWFEFKSYYNTGSSQWQWEIMALGQPIGFIGPWNTPGDLPATGQPRWTALVLSTGTIWRWNDTDEEWQDTGAAAPDNTDTQTKIDETATSGSWQEVTFDVPFTEKPYLQLQFFDGNGNKMNYRRRNLTATGFEYYVAKAGTYDYKADLI